MEEHKMDTMEKVVMVSRQLTAVIIADSLPIVAITGNVPETDRAQRGVTWTVISHNMWRSLVWC